MKLLTRFCLHLYLSFGIIYLLGLRVSNEIRMLVSKYLVFLPVLMSDFKVNLEFDEHNVV